MGKTLKSSPESETVAVAVAIDTETKQEQQQMYAVFRDRFRVSESYYASPRDEYCLAEKNYWIGIIRRWPDGTKINVFPIRPNGSAIRPERKKRVEKRTNDELSTKKFHHDLGSNWDGVAHCRHDHSRC